MRMDGRGVPAPAILRPQIQGGGSVNSDEIGSTRTRYRDAGYCVSGPLLDEATARTHAWRRGM